MVNLISVEGSFVPSGVSGLFFIWAMDRTSDSDTGRWRALSAHPQVLPAELLYPAIRGVPYVNALTCTAKMPSPSEIRPVRISGLALSVGNAVQWLLDIEKHLDGTGLKPGWSLRAWSSASKLMLELLAQGQCLPVLRLEAGCLAARWQLATANENDSSRIRLIENTIPDVCRAIVPPDRKHTSYRHPSRQELMTTFLSSAASELAMTFVAAERVAIADSHLDSAVHHWLRGLVKGPADLPPGLTDGHTLLALLDSWVAPATGVRGHVVLSTGLRIHLPSSSASRKWPVELVLVTNGSPPSAIPASHAWSRVGRDLEWEGERYSHAEQRILSDLPVMARLWTALEPLLSVADPSVLEVDEDAIVSLLEEGASVLERAGYPVYIPREIVKSGPVRACMRLTSPGQSHLGLNQIVSVDWDLALGGIPLSYDELEKMARQKRALVRHRDSWVAVDPKLLEAALRSIAPYRAEIPLGQALRLGAGNASDPGSSDGLIVQETVCEGWVKDVLKRLEDPGTMDPVPVPEGFIGVLRPYQKRGLQWLAFLRRYALGGCLADDMGLGKTVQIIALLLHERLEGWASGPSLIVCPVSLVGNWRRELSKFAPSLRVMVHHGAARAGREEFVSEATKHDAVITTYSLLARDEEQLAAVEWSDIIADEAQNVKNPVTKHAQALRRLRSEFRVALTGTPVENHLGDLWAILGFLNPGYLGSEEAFRRGFAVPIERYRDSKAIARLKRIIGPFLLRRLKTDPAIAGDLPEKSEFTVYTALTVEQAALYEAVVQDVLDRVAGLEGISRFGAMLSGLTRLKQVCNHPMSLLGDSGPMEGRSGKLDRLVEMLDEVVQSKDCALIFTQYAQFGAVLRPYLSRRLGCEVLFLDGSTPQQERERLINKFQAGEAPLFLLSLKAGGVGLNLTAANHVFHFDRWWNPAVEEQATDRAHRIGQSRKVMVHKLVTAGTLEERIDRLLSEKRYLSDQVIGSGEAWLGNLSTDELRDLITLQKED